MESPPRCTCGRRLSAFNTNVLTLPARGRSHETSTLAKPCVNHGLKHQPRRCQRDCNHLIDVRKSRWADGSIASEDFQRPSEQNTTGRSIFDPESRMRRPFLCSRRRVTQMRILQLQPLRHGRYSRSCQKEAYRICCPQANTFAYLASSIEVLVQIMARGLQSREAHVSPHSRTEQNNSKLSRRTVNLSS